MSKFVTALLPVVALASQFDLKLAELMEQEDVQMIGGKWVDE